MSHIAHGKVQVTTRMSPDLRRELEELAALENRTLTQEVELALKRYVAEKRAESGKARAA